MRACRLFFDDFGQFLGAFDVVRQILGVGHHALPSGFCDEFDEEGMQLLGVKFRDFGGRVESCFIVEAGQFSLDVAEPRDVRQLDQFQYAVFGDA